MILNKALFVIICLKYHLAVTSLERRHEYHICLETQHRGCAVTPSRRQKLPSEATEDRLRETGRRTRRAEVKHLHSLSIWNRKAKLILQAKPFSTFFSVQTFPWQRACLWLCIIGISQRGREKRSFCTFRKIKVKRTELWRHTGSCLVSALRGWVSASGLLSMQGSKVIFRRIGRRYTSGRLAGIIPRFIEPVLLSRALSYLVSINKQTFTECLPDAEPAAGGNLTNNSSPSPNLHINVLLWKKKNKKQHKIQLCHQDDSSLFEEKTESPRKR